MHKISQRAQVLADFLLTINGDVSYSTLEAKAEISLARMRPALATARAVLEREYQVVFETVRGVGLRRMTDGGKVASTDQHRAKLRTTAKRGLKRLDAVENFEGLTNEDQMRATINRTIFANTVRAAVGKRPAPGPITRSAPPDLSFVTRKPSGDKI